MRTEQKSIGIKEKQVNDLVENIKKSKTLMFVSIKSLPSKQFNEIKKAIRGDASVKIARKNIIMRALKGLKKDSILKLQEYVQSDLAIVTSDKDGYELAGILASKKTSANAKAGQIAPGDIEVKEGPTDLVPGPAISELGSLGIQVSVENGKISIKNAKVVVKEGREITAAVASLLQKLNIHPFQVGLNPILIYDVESEKIYTHINIDPKLYSIELKNAAGNALGFAQKIVYYCRESIGYLMAKADSQEKALKRLVESKNIKENAGEEK